MKRYLYFAIGAACVIGTFSAAIPAQAATMHPQMEVANPGEDATTVTRVILPFSSAITLEQAIQLAGAQSEPAAGFRFDNGEVVGEYSTGTDQTQADFLARFDQRFGTSPEVVGIIVERVVPTNEAQPQRNLIDEKIAQSVATIETGLPAFNAPPVPESKRLELSTTTPEPTSRQSVAPMSSSGNWAPDNVRASTIRDGNSQYFTNMVTWNTSTPSAIDARFGMEVGIDLYNGATGTRGYTWPTEICGPNFRDQFIAKNYNWHSWTVFSPNGSISDAVPYADLNDLFDSCGRNAMTVGFKDPQNIRSDNFGMYELITQIDAQVGSTNSSAIGGGIQLVDKVNCGNFSLTDCMGTGLLHGETRSTLSVDRGAQSAWVANPDRCWNSGDFGDSLPTITACIP